jgi:hypothetical protein
MSYKIIVARYNENIEWLSSEHENCIIYNKGTKLNLDNEIMLENVGRESDTYLNYIISNYDNLPEVVVFTQARISDHKGCDDVKYLLIIKEQALLYSKSNNYKIHNDIGANIHFDKEWNLRNGEYYLQDNYRNNKPITFINWFQNHINLNYPNPIIFYHNAIFAVRKEKILLNPLEYYKNLLLEVNHHSDPAEGHFFERSWYYIFQ